MCYRIRNRLTLEMGRINSLGFSRVESLAPEASLISSAVEVNSVRQPLGPSQYGYSHRSRRH